MLSYSVNARFLATLVFYTDLKWKSVEDEKQQTQYETVSECGTAADSASIDPLYLITASTSLHLTLLQQNAN